MKLSETIRNYRNDHGMSLREFASRCGISPAYISMIENERNPKTGEPIKPSLKYYRAIASGMGMSTGELLSAVDDMVSLSDFPANTSPLGATTRRPRLGAIACGNPITAEQNIEGYDEVPDYIKCDFTLVCRGDSMTGARIFDGDLVCIRQQPTVESGQIAAVLVDGEATLKRVRFLDDGVILLPENPAYPPQVYTGDAARNVRIIGLATHFISTIK